MGYKKYLSKVLKFMASLNKTTKRMDRMLSHTTTENNQWLYSAEVMQRLQISESTLRRMRARNEIPHHKIGRTYRYPSVYIEQTLLNKVKYKYRDMFDEEKE